MVGRNQPDLPPAEVWQDIVTFARRVEAVNVDKKRATINMIGKICDLARRRAA